MSTPQRGNRTLVATMTNEPFQPVRLYYRIPSKARVQRKLRTLDCMTQDSAQRCWEWLYHGEAKSLRFTRGGYDDVPLERRPIILARIHFPKSGEMTLQANSIERAIAAARFFAPLLGPRVVATRCRVVNRFFAAGEGTLAELMQHLDQNVTVIDPQVNDAKLREDLKALGPVQSPELAIDIIFKKRLESGEDVPPVEDYPLAPDEENPDLQHLSFGLKLRLIRAMEHWKGNTHMTLPLVIARAVEQGMYKD